jgi:predicted O-linked N-acetylglucosamine transferase (SPINDLY family)
LAQQPARLAELRTRLATQRSSVPLFNTALYTRHLEQAFHTMHERVIRGQNAAAFRVITQDL